MNKLYIEATSRCNLNCKMCFRHGWINEHQKDMEPAVFSRVLNSLKEIPTLKAVMFAGMGEPLVHKDICNMVSLVKQCGITVELLTNGSLLNQKMTDKLLYNGLDMLWISIDGFDTKSYEEIQIGSLFDVIIKNILYFSKKRSSCKLGFTFVITEDNSDQIKNINYFADRFSADEINISYYIPPYPMKKDNSIYDLGYSVGKSYRYGEKRTFINALCPFIEDKKCYIKWNGDVCPCMQLLHSSYTYFFEEKRTVLTHSFGNINEKTLKNIWNSREYASFRNKVHNFEFPDCVLCDGCDDRLSNEKDCLFNEKPTCGACLWARGIARCP